MPSLSRAADDLDIRLALRSGGGIGALVRLLRPDCEASVQAAAAGALSLLAARDIVVQDSVRYLVRHVTDWLSDSVRGWIASSSACAPMSRADPNMDGRHL